MLSYSNGLLCRQPDLYEESSASSDYSTGSTLPSNGQHDKTEQIQSDLCASYQGIGPDLQPNHGADLHSLTEGENEISCSQTTSQGIKSFAANYFIRAPFLFW